MPKPLTRDQLNAIDERWDEAVAHVTSQGWGTTSNLQKRLHIGYPRADRLLDDLIAARILDKAIVSQGEYRYRHLLIHKEELRRDDEPFVLKALDAPVVRYRPIEGERYLYACDPHVPFHDEVAVGLFASVLADKGFDWKGVFLGGDTGDFYQESHWDRSPSRDALVQDDLDATAGFCKLVSDTAGDILKVFIPGNHEARFLKHLLRVDRTKVYLRSNRIEHQLCLHELGYQVIPQGESYYLTPTFRIGHGAGGRDDGCVLSSVIGRTAGRNVEKLEVCGVTGHAHRCELVYLTTWKGNGQSTWDTRSDTRLWLSAPCLCDIKQTSKEYCKNPNWQQGFAEIIKQGDQVWVFPILVQDGKCIVEGKEFRA